MWKHHNFWWHWAVCTSKCLIQSGTLGGSSAMLKNPLNLLEMLEICLVVAVINDFHHKGISQDIQLKSSSRCDLTGRARNLDAAGVLMRWEEGLPLLLYQIYPTFWVLHQRLDATQRLMCEKTTWASSFSSCLHSVSFPPPQKNSCLMACCRPSKPQCTKDMKSSLLFICTDRSDSWLWLRARSRSLSRPKTSPSTTSTLHLGVLLKWKSVLTNQLCVLQKWFSEGCFWSAWAAVC